MALENTKSSRPIFFPLVTDGKLNVKFSYFFRIYSKALEIVQHSDIKKELFN